MSRVLARPAVATFALVLVAAAVSAVWTPWFLLGTDLLLITLAVRTRTSWAFGFSAGILALSAVAALLSRISPYVGLPLGVSQLIVLVLIGTVALISWRTGRNQAAASPDRVRLLAVTVIPVVCLVAVVIAGLSGRLGYSWAMQNDAVWNAVTARFVIDDAGLLPAHPNASPLTAVLMAVAAAPGRFAVGPAGLLQHDVAAFGQLWFVLALGTALLASLITIRSTARGSIALRILAGVAGGTFVLTWCAFGLALESGFYNATLILLILLAMWLSWLESERAPILACAALSAALVAGLATWAPLAVVPGLLLLLAIVRWWGANRSRGWRRVPIVASVLAAPVLYGATATLPDLLRQGAVLAADGGIFPLRASQAAITVAVCVSFLVFVEVRRGLSLVGIGLTAVVVAGGLGLGYLLAQRLHLSEIWGYYPIKMSWLLMTLLIVLVIGSIFGVAEEYAGFRLKTVVVLAAGALLVTGLMVQTPPTRRAIFPVLNIVSSSGVAADDQAARELFALARPGERVLVADYRDDATDRFIDGWTLQLESELSTDRIRFYSYYLQPSDPQGVCDAIGVWDAHVTVITSSRGFASRLASICAGRDYSVSVRG